MLISNLTSRSWARDRREPPVRLQRRDWVQASGCSRPKTSRDTGSAENLFRRNRWMFLPACCKMCQRPKALFQAAPVIDRTRLLLGQRVIEAPVAPPALSISRYDLDALLWDAARRAGVVAHPNCEVVGSDGDGPFTLQTSCGRVKAKALIVAAGRWSQFTADRTLPAGPKWIGLKAHFQEPWTEPCTDLYFFANGYCGVQPVTQGVVNACAMVRSDRATSLEEVLQASSKVGAPGGELARDHAAR